MTVVKLKALLEGKAGNYREDFLRSVSEYNRFGKSIYREDSLVDVAKSLSTLAEKTEYYTLQESGDWFDSVTVKRNMKELRDYSSQFDKCSKEAQALQERIVTLYEDMGAILGRYYSVEELNEVDGEDKEEVEEDEELPADQSLTEGVNKYNPDVVKSMLQTDHFLRTIYKQQSGGADQKLKKLYTSYITKDDEMIDDYNKLYKKYK